MQSSVGILERIDHVYPSLRPAERAVAQYIREHAEEAADLTVGQMADIAHVSQPTVIRFARKLGFGGYRELRYVLRHPAAEHQVTFDPLSGFDFESMGQCGGDSRQGRRRCENAHWRDV